ncbi:MULTISPECIES: Rv3654c family TadE-like protein [Microbacterium]|uniref:Rv3654c family TadE-like protein n=1 Tax=Microbacterium marmarense TaxID=3122051 RepID=A0ABU8LTG7_9MICO
MAGAVAAAGVVALTATLSVALVTAGSAHVVSQRLAAAADSAALAAADAASGAATGLPCERAAQVAQALGVQVSHCQLSGLVATVTVATTFAGLPAAASARAGPPR